ncbi:MAG: MG2 domain-containing protein [Cyclobacteriaceae bacterium]
MKSAPLKKIGLAVLGLSITIILILFFYPGTSKDGDRISLNPAFGEYISSYTAGVISSGSSVRIILTQDGVDASQIGQETSVKLISLSPSVSGKTVWLDGRTVEFTPSNRLNSGQVYELEFYLSKLQEVPKALSTFKYSFQVIPQNLELAIENIKPYVKTELTKQKIEGTVTTADFAADDAIAASLQAKQEGTLLPVVWTHTPEGKQHHFVIENVLRKETEGKVVISLDGKSIGVDLAKQEEVIIPALGDFKITNVRVEQGNAQAVVVQFSDPLRERQNLEGLINIAGLNSLEFEIKDNEVRVFPPVRQTGSKDVTIEAGIRNILDYRMKQRGVFSVQFQQEKPAVKFAGKGSVLPATDGLIMPFEAVNLKKVDLTVIKIYEGNVLQFLQTNNLSGNGELRRVGKPVLKKVISLDNVGVTDLGKWNRFTLDLSTLLNAEPGAIYQVRLRFRKSYLAYVCDDGSGDPSTASEMAAFSEEEEWDLSDAGEDNYWDSYEEYYYSDDYDWRERDNPCHSSYYTGDRNVKRNVLASDLGLIAKQGSDGNLLVVVNDIKTTQPLSGIQLELYDFQQQLIGSASSGPDGKAVISSKEQPFVLLAKNGSQRGYLKLNDGESLSLSNFDVGGERVDRGLKGFLYGERGVWRPGDSLYLTFLLEDKLKLLPATHPVVFELQNPQGQVTSRIVRSSSNNGFYNFATATSTDAPTGNWLGRVKVGGTEFTKSLKIETVKPNRLKINLDFGVDKITAGNNNVSGNLQVNWLHGAPGKNLKAEFEVVLNKAETKFEKFSNYTFDDPSLDFYSETQTVFEGYTDAEGHATVNTTLKISEAAPGKLNAVFRGKVFEESGNFSIDRFSIPYYPYSSFTGVKLPLGDKRGMLLTDTTHQAEVVTVDADGKPVSRSAIKMSLYKLEWSWWWDNSGGNANYMSGRNARPVTTGRIQTVNGKGVWNFKVNYPEWGRFLVKAYDPVSGHTTGKIVYIDWPGWAGRAREGGQGATMLSFSSDKPSYNIGEKANLIIPGSGQGRALVSVENGSKVIQTYWVETQQGDNQFSFDITREMTPNAFVNVTLLQPHSQAINDLPIRMYGIIPIQVEDPSTHLEPQISMPDVLEPGKEVVIKVSEKSNREMTYTLAIVDEGLLDLTKFATPDAWRRFYAREALGVKTWDLYDYVIGSYGGRVERLLAIGGDAELAGKQEDSKANRFKPVVKFFGPITLDGTNEHRFIMPQYIGSVKTMLVAGYEGAYGKVDKATPVRKPLMVLATLPRVLGPEENLKLPITIFSMEKNIQNVKVELKVSGPLMLPAGNSKSINMDGNTDLTTDFELAVKGETGFAKVEVTVSSGSYKATDVIDIEVRNPNPMVTRVQDTFLESGKSWSISLSPVGVVGTNASTLEISSLPPVNLGQRLKYLMGYPYGCIEQTTSSVFPQLYLDQIKVLTDAEKTKIQSNVTAGIERLKLFVNRDGGFAYWPGGENSDSWATTYAGHFLLEAKNKGYFVPNDMLRKWKRYQKDMAQSWRNNSRYERDELIQAYRLYTLALSGEPELGAMNRLREHSTLTATAKWMLASSYIKAGQPEAAKALISNVPATVKPYQELGYSYGSDLRDKAIILETLLLMNEREKGFALLKDISASLSNSSAWMSTQTVAWCLKAVGSFASLENKSSIKFTYNYMGKEVTASTELPIAQVQLPTEEVKSSTLNVSNTSGGSLFVSVISEGVPARGAEEDAESNLSMNVTYSDAKGNIVDPKYLEQGTEFMANVTIINPGLRGLYQNMALSQIFPSGWEVNNLRLDEVENSVGGSTPTYQDIRDDRVYTYFDIGPNQKKTFKVLLTATYAGSYYLPAVSCEAMYDRSIHARRKGQVVEVFKANINQ